MPDLLFRPEEPVSHNVEFATDILLSTDGNEKRSASLERPRQSVNYKLFFDDLVEMRRYRTHLFQSLNATWRVPLWWEPETITVETEAGTDELDGAFTNTDMAVGNTIVLFDPVGANDPHIAGITIVASGKITIDSAVTPAFPKGSQFFLLQDMRISGAPRLRRFGTSHEFLSIDFDFSRPTALGGAGASVSTFTHSADSGARSLLDRKPLSDSLTTYSFDAFAERIDFGRRFEQLGEIDPAALFETRRFAINSRSELQYWEQLAKVAVGAREPIYTPTYRDDLVIDTQPSGPGWDVIKVKDESDTVADSFDYVGQYFPHSSHKQLRFKTDQGEQYREVSSAVDNADGTNTLTLASGLTASSVISQISFLEYCRFADVFAFEHRSTSSIVRLGIKLIQRHPDE